MKVCMNECGTSKYMGSPAQPHHKMAENALLYTNLALGIQKDLLMFPLNLCWVFFSNIWHVASQINPPDRNCAPIWKWPIYRPPYRSLLRPSALSPSPSFSPFLPIRPFFLPCLHGTLPPSSSIILFPLLPPGSSLQPIFLTQMTSLSK